MVKIKSVVPQRLSQERRSELTWDLSGTEPLLGQVSNVTISHGAGSVLFVDGHATKDKLNRKRLRRKSLLEEEVNDACLRELLTGCAFYLSLRKELELNKNERAFKLGTVSLVLQTNSVVFPKNGECWLYVSEFPNRSLLYSECPDGVTYFLVDGTLDFQFFSGNASFQF
jgi:prepilin-type processing-associated H-X9-DG protein